MNFTHDNHLKYTVGGRLFGVRENPYEKYQVSVGRVDPVAYPNGNWLQEQYRIAELVYQNLGKDLVVMLSGGTDSEIILRSFNHIGVRPRAIFIEFLNGYNHHELIAAQMISDDVGIPLEIVQFDIIDFYKGGRAAELAKEIHCYRFGFLMTYQNILQIGAPAIMGGSVTACRIPTLEGSRWYCSYAEREDMAAFRLHAKYGIPLIPEWFSYTPESIAYFLEDPIIQWTIRERFNYKTWTDGMKNEVFQKWMPELIKKNKKHGFEHLLGFSHEACLKIVKEIPPRLESSLDGIFMEDIQTQLFGERKW